MHDLIEQGLTYVRGIWRFRWYGMALAWVIALSGWAYVSQLPDIYQVNARVHVDTDSVLRPLLRGMAIHTDVNQRVRLMNRTLINRPNMEKVARMTDLDLKARTPKEMDALLKDLSEDIRLSTGGERTNLYSISYEHTDPEIARNVVQSLLTIFVEGALGDSRENTDSAQKFLDEQILEYENRLIAAEEGLKEFKRKNVDIMSAGDSYFGRLQAAQSQLGQAELLLKEEVNRRDEIRRQLEGEEPSFGLAGDSSTASSSYLSPVDARIQTLKTEMDNLLFQYTDQHPSVMSIKDTIQSLEKQKESEAPPAVERKNINLELETNPVYQQMKISLAQAEANVASLSVRVKEYRARVGELDRMVDIVPEIEAQLARLNRDYDLNRKNYQELLARRESVKMGEDVDQAGDNVKFKVIDAPRVPLTPTGPNRILFSGIVLLASLGGGLALSFLLSQIRPAFYDQRTLQQVIGYPVFGTVSRVWTKDVLTRRRVEFGAFLSVSGLLVFAYGVVFLKQSDAMKLFSTLIN